MPWLAGCPSEFDRTSCSLQGSSDQQDGDSLADFSALSAYVEISPLRAGAVSLQVYLLKEEEEGGRNFI